MVVVTDLNKIRKGPKDKAVAFGKKVDEGLLGLERRQDYFGNPQRPNPFVADQKDNPDFRNFYTNANTFVTRDAPYSQAKFDSLATAIYSDFGIPADPVRVYNWTDAYHDGAKRGLINPENEVGPWSVENLATQYAGEGDAKIDPNVTGVFPSQDVKV